MYLQRIELQGFKSFASKTVLEFPAVNSVAHSANNGIGGVTAIVGPNGSGKSNVVDAVRWVLGEQSLKLLRGKKATDVIFAGSAQKSQLGLAEVSLYLNNEDRLAPVDYSEIVITRKLYRDGDSDYLINKQTVRLFDVVMLLARANFGQNTYSVIGQGMVDRIVNYSAQERKDFFDEATGVKQFQIKRDRSVSKLKKSRENLERVKTLLQELDPHLKSLTRQVNRLQKRKEVEIELRDLQIQYYGRLWLDLDSAYQIQAGAFALKEKDKIKLEQQVGGLQERLEELSQERGRAETFSRLQADYDKLAGQRNAWWQQLAEVKGQLTGEYLKLGQPDLSWLEKRQSAIDEQLKNLNYEIADLENQINRHQKIFSAKIARQAEALADFKELENKLLRLQKEFNSELGISNQEIRLAVNRLYSLQKDFIAQLKTAATLEALATIQAEAELIFAEMETFYRRLSQEKQHQASREISDLQSQLSGFLKNKDLLVNEINEVKIKLEVAVSQRQSLIGKAAELNLELEKVKSDLSSGQAKNQNELSNSLKQEKAALEKQLSELESKLTLVKGKIDNFNEEEEQKKQTIFTLQQQLYQLQAQLNLVVGSLNEIKVELARIDTKKEDLFSAMRHD
jgi:chromosome segregation protein